MHTLQRKLYLLQNDLIQTCSSSFGSTVHCHLSLDSLIPWPYVCVSHHVSERVHPLNGTQHTIHRLQSVQERREGNNAVWNTILQNQELSMRNIQVPQLEISDRDVLPIEIFSNIVSHVHVCQQCIVRGWGQGQGLDQRTKKDQKKIKDTTKPLMANLDITQHST